MIEALAAIGGGGVVGLAAAVVVMAFKIVSYASQQLELRDLLDGEREQHRKTRGELEVETAAHAVTRTLLSEEKQLREQIEAQRNAAWRDAREDAVRLIETSGIADAARLGNRILHAPLPGVRRSESGPDALIDPDL